MADEKIGGFEAVRKLVEGAEPDLLRTVVQEMVTALMGAEVEAMCGAGYGERSPDRVNARNGYRTRPWDTRVGSMALAIPKLREGTYFMRNLLVKVPKSAQGLVATLVRMIFAQPDAELTGVQHARVVEQLEARWPAAAQLLRDAEADPLAFAHFPKEHWRQIWSNNPQERLNREIKSRTDVVGIFPNREAIIWLVGAVLAEQHDEWAVVRCSTAGR